MAERHAHTHPDASLVQTRRVGEGLLKELHACAFGEFPKEQDEGGSFGHLIWKLQQSWLPRTVANKLRAVKNLGNGGAHYDAQPQESTPDQAFRALRELHDAAKYLGLHVFRKTFNISIGSPGSFEKPPRPQSEKELRAELEQAQRELEELREESGRLTATSEAPTGGGPDDAASAEAAVRELGLDDTDARQVLSEVATLGFALTYRDARDTLPESVRSAATALEHRLTRSPGEMSLAAVDGAPDPKLKLTDLGTGFAAVLLAPESDDVRVLLWVGARGDAIAWARARRFEIHETTGALQEVLVGEPAVREASDGAAPIVGAASDEQLLKLGVPSEFVKLIPEVRSDEAFEAILALLPAEAGERLLKLATGDPLERVLAEARAAAATSTGRRPAIDLELALRHPDARRRFFVPESVRALEKALEKPLDAWRLFLHPDQAALVRRRFRGPARVLGGAGTGKTVVAVHRARHLARTLGREGGRILFTTYSRNLAENLRPLVTSICGADAEAVEVTHIDSWAVGLLHRSDVHPDIANEEAIESAWEAALRETDDPVWPTVSEFRDEFEWAIEQHGARTANAYVGLPRTGRGRLGRGKQLAAFEVFERFRKHLGEQMLWVDIHARACEIVAALPEPPYRAMVVDEAQDMTGEQLRLIRALAPEDDNDLFFVGDAHQRIYRKPVVFSACGIQIRGRSRRLTLNYRTTETIRRFAIRSLEGQAFDDLDGGDDTDEGCVSLRPGVAPNQLPCDSTEDEANRVATEIASLLEGGCPPGGVCAVARQKQRLGAIGDALTARDVPVHRLHERKKRQSGRSKKSAPEKEAVSLTTMHRVKGLEFLHVFLVGVEKGEVPRARLIEGADETARARIERQERSLFYVAGTRARERLYVSWVGEPSPFIAPGRKRSGSSE